MIRSTMPATARMAVAAAAALIASAALAEVTLPTRDIPVPAERPHARTAEIDTTTTGSVTTMRSARLPVVMAAGGPVAPLKTGLDALSRGDFAAARAARDALPAASLDHRILAWAVAIGGGDGVPSSEIAAAAALLPDWPGMAALRRNGERALAREEPDAASVVRAFAVSGPQTIEGVTLLARAHVALGQTEAARKVLSPFWRTERLDATGEAAIIAEFGRLIPAADHRVRMERMLYGDRAGSAERVAGLAGASELARAWAAVIRGDKNARALLDAVPGNQRSAGYLYALAKHLRRREHFAQAAEIMLKAPRDRASLVDPDAWWVERRVLSRELLDIGKPELAYRIAAAHAAESPASAADAEFHAGWYALRFIGDAKTAAGHFARIVQISSGAISQSRAYYWLGRAAEAGGPGHARNFYAQAANHGTAFYGQLAAARLGRGAIAARFPEPNAADRRNFARREAVAAIRRLEEAGHASRASILYRDLADQLTSPGELALLAVMAERRGDHFLALRVGKAAAARGLDVGALAHPVGAIPGTAQLSDAGTALAYAIARQESEFNVGAVSGAGARGLLQLLPGTAREMARKAGLPYSQPRLTTDAGYNATLGAAFLTEQLDRFDGSYVLTFAGYNAGPRRAREWVDRYGDPRGQDMDAVVDWIERIPFTETRGYVQRVMENYQVYKMRLTGHVDVVADLTHGR